MRQKKIYFDYWLASVKHCHLVLEHCNCMLGSPSLPLCVELNTTEPAAITSLVNVMCEAARDMKKVKF